MAPKRWMVIALGLLLFALTNPCAVLVDAAETEVSQLIEVSSVAIGEIHSFQLKGRVKKGQVLQSPTLGRPSAIPAITEDFEEYYSFEDRLDLAHGRALLKARTVRKQEIGPDSAYVHLRDKKRDQSELPLNALRFIETPADVFTAFSPFYAGFDLLELLRSHPDTRLQKLENGIWVLEIPKSSLAEYSEFGARIMIDPARSHALTGIDLYVVCDGEEVLLRRTDIERSQHGEYWVPLKIVTWERIGTPTRDNRLPRTQITEVTIDWDKSTVNRHLSRDDINLTAMSSMEQARTEVGGGWSILSFKQQPTMEITTGWTGKLIFLLINSIAILAVCVSLCVRQFSLQKTPHS